MTAHAAVSIIYQEHANLASLLRAMLAMLADRRGDGATPDFAALRAMMFYVDEFAEKRHHRVESEVLFTKLRARAPLARQMLDRLDEEHAQGERRIRNLEFALLSFEILGECRRSVFEVELERYVNFYFAHMALEEREILPLAEHILSEQDWIEVDAAFRSNLDPLTGRAPAANYADLFETLRVALKGGCTPQEP